MMRYGTTLLCCILLLAACSGDRSAQIPPQTWNDMVVRVETRPTPPMKGMNEVWVILNEASGRPVADYVVSVGTSGDPRLQQAIQDGLTGVYRRAIPVRNPATDQILVRLRKDSNETTLTFPLPVAQSRPVPN